ncbi:MAG: beta-lactamase family protein [Deltaproteobacteria bacterium]|nr:beta-lactamase family protein [Deltaproteobacteria bacterium]
MAFSFSGVDRLMEDALGKKVFPGAVLLASSRGDIVYHKAFGVSNLCTCEPVTLETVFDLASLTKPLATTMSVMAIVDEGRLGLDLSLGQILPGFENNEKAGITICQLLLHTAGFPDWQPYYQTLMGYPDHARKGIVQKLLLSEPLVHAPGDDTLYSDIGFMVLQWVVEKVSGQSLDQYLSDVVYRGLGIEGLFFNNSLAPSPGFSDFAATEICPVRNRLLSGEVHDENAFFMGGVAGHSGLFGTAEAVHRLITCLAAICKGSEESSVLSRETVRKFLSCPLGAKRAHGFDIPSGDMPCAGRFCSPKQTFGHLGFTGTSFWMDLSASISIILLTNRVHPVRTNNRIRKFRPEIHDAIMLALGVD